MSAVRVAACVLLGGCTLRSGFIALLFGPAPIIAVQRCFGPRCLWLFHCLNALCLPMIVPLWGWACWRGGRAVGAQALFTATVAGVSAMSLSVLLRRPRPSDVRIVPYETLRLPSFPSTHAAVATALWGFLAMQRLVPGIVAAPAIGGVALARIYLGVHHLGDVLTGPLVGLMVLLLGRRRAIWFTTRQELRKGS